MAEGAYTHCECSGCCNSDWMEGLDDNLPLSGISMPGTHDSMSFHGGVMTQCQSLPLIEQLNSGVRALDIRCRHFGDSFTIHHGITYQRANFDDVLSTVQAFLEDHPSETILMRVKEEHKPENCTRPFSDTFDMYSEKYPGLFWPYDDTIPNLGTVRGQVVVLQDFDHLPQVGIRWQSMNIQDEYQVNTQWDLHKKWDAVKAQLENATNGDPNAMYINFLSGSGGAFPYFVASGKIMPSDNSSSLTMPGNATTNPDFPSSRTLGITTITFIGTNILTAERLPQYGRVGVLYADFPGKDLIDGIIQKN